MESDESGLAPWLCGSTTTTSHCLPWQDTRLPNDLLRGVFLFNVFTTLGREWLVLSPSTSCPLVLYPQCWDGKSHARGVGGLNLMTQGGKPGHRLRDVTQTLLDSEGQFPYLRKAEIMSTRLPASRSCRIICKWIQLLHTQGKINFGVRVARFHPCLCHQHCEQVLSPGTQWPNISSPGIAYSWVLWRETLLIYPFSRREGACKTDSMMRKPQNEWMMETPRWATMRA